MLAAQAPRTTPRFRPADPVAVDNDTIADASAFEELELSEGFDLLANQFASPGDRTPKRAVNVNTVDEVPDSSWFTNRIGIRPMPMREIVRGANKFDPVEAREWDTWTVVEGKGPRSFQPGFRAERPGDPGQVYQLEVDPKGHPRLATGAEFIGGLIYHALGYFVEDVYVLKVHPRNIRISEKATIRDASGRRKFTSHDLDNILSVAAKDEDGRVYMSATRYDGKDLGNFEYHGTRSDDPNDIYPHEHRRELRANRVFAAWLAHDDSRALNTRNVRVVDDGRNYIRHYVRDFGAILGSSTRFTEPPISNHEYYVEKDSSLKRLFTLGFYTPDYVRARAPENIPPSVGWFESSSFEPDAWKPNYPNTAFSNMQPDDAFWGARLVSQFSDGAIRAIVEQAGYDDPQAVEYLDADAHPASGHHRAHLVERCEPDRGCVTRREGNAQLHECRRCRRRRHARHLHHRLGPLRQRFREQREGVGRKADATARGRARVVDRERRLHRGHDLERAGGASRMGVAGAGLLPPRRRGVEDRRPHAHDRLRQPAVNVTAPGTSLSPPRRMSRPPG